MLSSLMWLPLGQSWEHYCIYASERPQQLSEKVVTWLVISLSYLSGPMLGAFLAYVDSQVAHPDVQFHQKGVDCDGHYVEVLQLQPPLSAPHSLPIGFA